LTPTDIQEETTAAGEQTALEETHTHEGHDHEHHHHAAPTLNPELTRSIAVEAPAEDVIKAFQQVVKRYTKLASAPARCRRR
jgi:trigger factor